MRSLYSDAKMTRALKITPQVATAGRAESAICGCLVGRMLVSTGIILDRRLRRGRMLLA